MPGWGRRVCEHAGLQRDMLAGAALCESERRKHNHRGATSTT
jgi:hypothetical protein